MRYQTEKNKKKNKRKGLIFTFVFHSIALLLALYPLMTMQQEQKEEIRAVLVEFDFGAKEEGAKKVKKQKAEQKRQVQKVTPITKQAPKILTTELPSDLKMPKVKRPVKKVEKVPEPIPSDIPSPSQEIKITAPKVHIPAPSPSNTEAEEVDGSEDGEVSDAEVSGEGEGEKGEGSFDEGDKAGEGTGFIEGNGTLTRKVVKRSPINGIVKKNGVIVLKICVTRNGLVDYVEFDHSNSTIHDAEVVREAQKALSQYRFEADYGAAERECGRFSYTIDLGK